MRRWNDGGREDEPVGAERSSAGRRRKNERTRTRMSLWSSQCCRRQVPQHDLAILADTDESHRSLFAPPRIPGDARHPRCVTLAVRDEVLLERSVDGTEIVLSAGLQEAGGESMNNQVREKRNVRRRIDHLGRKRRN